MAYAARLKRRISSDVLIPPNSAGTHSDSNLSQSLQTSITPQPMISLHANGLARLIFRPDPTWFEGVLISDDGEETFSITGSPNKKFLAEANDRRVVDVSVTDGETGQLYIIRHIDLLPPRESMEENDDIIFDDQDIFKTLSKPRTFNNNPPKTELELGVSLDSNSRTALHESHEVPRYELKSDVLTFSTDDILIGNRADKEIRSFLNPALVGRLLNVHVGPMKVAFSRPITPPPIEAFNRRRRRHSAMSICTTNFEEVIEKGEEEREPTDADINFLM